MKRFFVGAVVAAVAFADAASAQNTIARSPDVIEVRDTSSAPRARSSTLDRPSDAVRRSAVVPAAPLPAATQSLGPAKAQMAVGGAAIVVGALIGGDGGNVLMLGGAVVGLYGLWNYLK